MPSFAALQLTPGLGANYTKATVVSFTSLAQVHHREAEREKEKENAAAGLFAGPLSLSSVFIDIWK